MLLRLQYRHPPACLPRETQSLFHWGPGDPTTQTSSPGLTGGSRGFKDFLDSGLRRNDGKSTYSKVL